MDLHHKIPKAAQLCFLMSASIKTLSIPNALFCVNVSRDHLHLTAVIDEVKSLVENMKKEKPCPKAFEPKEMVELYFRLKPLVKRLPSNFRGRANDVDTVTRAGIMKMAGFDTSDQKYRSSYKSISHREEKIDAEEAARIVKMETVLESEGEILDDGRDDDDVRIKREPFVVRIKTEPTVRVKMEHDEDFSDNSPPKIIRSNPSPTASEVSSVTGFFESSLSSNSLNESSPTILAWESALETSETLDPNDFHNHLLPELLGMTRATKLNQRVRSKAMVALSKALSIPRTHRSSRDVFNENVLSRIAEELHKLAYKVATTIADSELCKEGIVNSLSTFDKISDSVNQTLGFNLISGREIKRAVKCGRVGQDPPKMGAPTKVPVEIIHELARLQFTVTTIDQNNGDKRLSRSDYTSLIGEVVNDWLECDGKDPVRNDVRHGSFRLVGGQS